MRNELTTDADFGFMRKSCNSSPQLYLTIPSFSHIVGWLATAKLLAVKTNSQAMDSQGSKPANQAVTTTCEAAQPGAQLVAADPSCFGAVAARATANSPANNMLFGSHA